MPKFIPVSWLYIPAAFIKMFNSFFIFGKQFGVIHVH